MLGLHSPYPGNITHSIAHSQVGCLGLPDNLEVTAYRSFDGHTREDKEYAFIRSRARLPGRMQLVSGELLPSNAVKD